MGSAADKRCVGSNIQDENKMRAMLREFVWKIFPPYELDVVKRQILDFLKLHDGLAKHEIERLVMRRMKGTTGAIVEAIRINHTPVDLYALSLVAIVLKSRLMSGEYTIYRNLSMIGDDVYRVWSSAVAMMVDKGYLTVENAEYLRNEVRSEIKGEVRNEIKRELDNRPNELSNIPELQDTQTVPYSIRLRCEVDFVDSLPRPIGGRQNLCTFLGKPNSTAEQIKADFCAANYCRPQNIVRISCATYDWKKFTYFLPYYLFSYPVDLLLRPILVLFDLPRYIKRYLEKKN